MWLSKEDMQDWIIAVILLIILVIIFSDIKTTKDTKEVAVVSGLQQAGDTGQILPANGNELVQKQEISIKEEPIPAYKLSNSERDLVERVIMGLAKNEEVIVQKAIAQCILNACIIFDERPDYIIHFLRYTEYRPTPSIEVKQSVSDVFDNGEFILEQDVLYLYNYIQSCSDWHESQEYVCTIGSYKFFK